MGDFWPFLAKMLQQKVLTLAIFRGGDFWRKISPNWRILIKQSWEHWLLMWIWENWEFWTCVPLNITYKSSFIYTKPKTRFKDGATTVLVPSNFKRYYNGWFSMFAILSLNLLFFHFEIENFSGNLCVDMFQNHA